MKSWHRRVWRTGYGYATLKFPREFVRDGWLQVNVPYQCRKDRGRLILERGRPDDAQVIAYMTARADKRGRAMMYVPKIVRQTFGLTPGVEYRLSIVNGWPAIRPIKEEPNEGVGAEG